MRKVSKRVVLALVCAVAMMASMISVSAAGIKRANHVCVYKDPVVESGAFINEGDTHKQEFQKVRYCQDYGEKCMGKVVISTWTTHDSHTWSDAYDMGHRNGDEHAFSLKCGICGGQKEVHIVCEYNRTGRHSTPW